MSDGSNGVLEKILIRVVDPAPRAAACSKEWQFLEVPAPDELCRAKSTPGCPVETTAECPCRWRTLIQDDYKIVTPPALYLWELPRILTSCNNIWNSPFKARAML